MSPGAPPLLDHDLGTDAPAVGPQTQAFDPQPVPHFGFVDEQGGGLVLIDDQHVGVTVLIVIGHRNSSPEMLLLEVAPGGVCFVLDPTPLRIAEEFGRHFPHLVLVPPIVDMPVRDEEVHRSVGV